MAAPDLAFSVSGHKVSSISGYDHISVTFTSDAAYKAFECRATKVGDQWGVGRGSLVASFSQTPANTPRSFDVYDDYLINGDGEYRISLLAQGTNGEWNITTTILSMFEFPFGNGLNGPELIMGTIQYD